jgi:purine-nucleoside/S-methyl-5'-thioadenosine phosphorylase / adenosine deaminase
MMFMSEPQPNDGFVWTQARWGPILRCQPLLEIADHFFTAASVELRQNDSEWDAVAALAGVPRRQLRLLHQVHGRTVVVSRATGSWTPPQADGVVSDDASAAFGVRVADCAPILIGDRRTGSVAAVHAGWRSTMQRIGAEAVAVMQRELRSDPGDLVAAIGPCLGPCCGEMGEEVVQGFRDARHDDATIARWFSREDGRRPHFDLWRANVDQLVAAGLPAGSIHVAGLCTRTYPEVFHSYRVRGTQAGRMVGVIRPTAASRSSGLS